MLSFVHAVASVLTGSKELGPRVNLAGHIDADGRPG
jgi:hypothetical protein